MTTSTSTAVRRYAGTPVQKVALVFGLVFLLVGVAGFIPGVTQNHDTLMFAGHESEAMLLGLFQVSVLHNMVHLLFGIVGLAVAARAVASRMYLIWGGVIYAVLWIYGLFTAGMTDPLNFVPLNTADNWLHAGLAVAMILLGIFIPRASPVRADPAPRV